jgi:hypothetical protein
MFLVSCDHYRSELQSGHGGGKGKKKTAGAGRRRVFRGGGDLVLRDEDVELGEGFVEGVVEGEELVEVRDFENLVELGADAGDDDLTFDGVEGAFDLEQHAEGLGGHEADLGEFEDELAGVLLFDEVKQIAAEGLDVGGIEDGDVLKTDNGYIAITLNQ